MLQLKKPTIMKDAKPLRTVHVTIPASVAYDFEKITKVTKNILGKLGCTACHSGHDIRFIIEDKFHVDEKLNVFSALER
jgi:hypothetical protein